MSARLEVWEFREKKNLSDKQSFFFKKEEGEGKKKNCSKLKGIGESDRGWRQRWEVNTASSAALWAPQSKTCQLAQSLVRGGRRQPGDVGGAWDATASYGPFCLFPLFALASGHSWRGGSGWAPWAEPFSAAWEGRSGQGCSAGGSWPPSLTTLGIPGCCAWKAATNHQSLTGCFLVSVSVFFTFFDLWTMKCFPEEWVPFEMHILKVLYSINGLVFLSHFSQTR